MSFGDILQFVILVVSVVWALLYIGYNVWRFIDKINKK